MIISKYEILDTKICVFDKWLMRPINNAIFAKIRRNLNESKKEDIWICNLHLSSDITLFQQKYQLNQLKDFIVSNDLKNLIIVGDFNIPFNLFDDLEFSFNKNFKNCLRKDSHFKSFPTYRPELLLDYYYTDLNNINDYDILKTDLSDHFPFTVSI